MIFRSVVLSLFLTFAAGQDGCSICGDGKGVSNPDAIFLFPGQPSVPCGLLELAGETGQIPISQCAFLPPLISMCECAPLSDIVTPTLAPLDPTPAPIAPTPVPTQAPTRRPTPLPTPPPTPTPLPTAGATPAPVPAAVPSICTTIPSNGCSVCGEDLYVSNADSVFEFPGQPAVPCGILEIAGETGSVPIDSCGVLPPVISITCGCTACPDPNVNTVAPTPGPTVEPTLSPTPNPTRLPTPAPTTQPTPAPTDPPTSAPTKAPTPMPVPVAPTPFPVFVFTPAPVEMMDDDETGDDDSGGKKAKKNKSKKNKSEKSAKKDRSSSRNI